MKKNTFTNSDVYRCLLYKRHNGTIYKFQILRLTIEIKVKNSTISTDFLFNKKNYGDFVIWK